MNSIDVYDNPTKERTNMTEPQVVYQTEKTEKEGTLMSVVVNVGTKEAPVKHSASVCVDFGKSLKNATTLYGAEFVHHIFVTEAEKRLKSAIRNAIKNGRSDVLADIEDNPKLYLDPKVVAAKSSIDDMAKANPELILEAARRLQNGK